MGLTIRNISVDGLVRTEVTSGPPSPPPPPPPPPFTAYTSLLLPGTGTNNTNNNVFVDSSSNNFTVTRVGNTTQGSFSPFSTGAGYWSNYFDGTGDGLSTTMTSNAIGSGDFTIEMWFYTTSAGTAQALFDTRSPDTTAGLNIYLSTSLLVVGTYGTNFITGTGNTILSNTWYHVAVTRQGTSMRMFLNGVQIGGTATNSNNFSNTATRIGQGLNGVFNGYISNFRLVRNSALYTANFTPSTTPLTAVSGTSLLTCQSNRFVDNSSNAFAITKAGDTRVSGFGPYAPASSYNASTMGGSMLFDGSGDYLTVPADTALNLGTGDFTIEAWVYIVAGQAGGAAVIGSGVTGPYLIYFNGAQSLVFYAGTSSGWAVDTLVITSNLSIGAWNHIAVTRSGTTFSSYLNGVRANTATSSASLKSGATTNIGYYSASLNGYISGLRIVKGTALYTAATYTVPTSAPTAISGTSLLLNGTNGAIADQTGRNDLETVGDAKVSTTVSANGSIYLDGTDSVTSPPGSLYAYGTGDFTVEAWIYPTDTNAGNALIYAQSVSGTNYFTFYFMANRTIGFIGTSSGGGSMILGPSAINLNAWSHVAVVRNSGTVTVYVNGVGGTATSNTTNFTDVTYVPTIGAYSHNGSNNYTGYINDLIITKGQAKYTSTFTPPARS